MQSCLDANTLLHVSIFTGYSVSVQFKRVCVKGDLGVRIISELQVGLSSVVLFSS